MTVHMKKYRSASIVILTMCLVCIPALLSRGETLKNPISPYLVGNNVWYPHPPFGEEHWEMAAEAGLQLVRIGGHRYDREMPSIEQLEEWVARIKGMGAEPMIQVSQYGSAEDAARIVKHFNVDTDNPVRFWNIGNEPWLQRERPDLGTMAGIIATYVRSFASAMKAVDPEILIYAPDMCEFHTRVYQELLGSGPNSIAGKDENGHYYIDGISWHRYVGNDLATSGAADFQERIEKTRAMIDKANLKHGRAGSSALRWGIGEFNSNGGSGVHTFANGQMFGQILGHAMKNGATYAATWSIFEHEGDRKGTDFGFIDGPTGKPRASYYHMQMISRDFSGGFFVDSTSSEEDVRTFAAVSTNKAVIMLINVGGDDHRISLDLSGIDPVGVGGTCRVSVDSGIAATYSGSIGKYETQMLVLDGAGQLKKRTIYNKRHFDKRPPKITNF